MNTSNLTQRIQRYVDTRPPAVSGARGHDQTFAVACALYNGFALDEAQTLYWLRVYNTRCKPPWSEKELVHKASEAAKAKHDKSRGHLLKERAPSPEDFRNSKTPKSAAAGLSGENAKLPEPMENPTVAFLEAAFVEGETICIESATYTARELQKRLDDDSDFEEWFIAECESEKQWPPARPLGRGIFKTREEWISIFEKNGDSLANGGLPGIFVVVNPFPMGTKRRKDDAVETFRHALLEFDTINRDEQWKLIRESNIPCSVVIDSGGKSLHAWVKIEARTRAEYDKKVDMLYAHFDAYAPDKNCRNPARLSRLPGARRHAGTQQLLAINVGAHSFDAWARENGVGEFPIHCFPDPYRKMIEEVGRAAGVPADITGPLMIGLLSSAVGRSVKMPSTKGLNVYGNPFILLGVRSGSGKSVAWKHIFQPFEAHETAGHMKWKQDREPRLLAEKKLIEAKLKKKPNKDSEGEQIEEMAALQTRLVRIEKELLSNRLSVEDVTVETLAVKLEANDESISLLSADARKVISNILGRYNPGKQVDDDILLKMFSGDRCMVDRLSRAPVNLRNPIGNVVLLVQPDKFRALVDSPEIRTGGFLARCLACESSAEMEFESGEDHAPDQKTVKHYNTRVDELLETFRPVGRGITEIEITAEPDAHKLLLDFHNDIVARMKAGELAGLDAFVSRYREQAYKVCVLIHCARWGDLAKDRQVDVKTVRDAIEIVRWFSQQQMKFLAASNQVAETGIVRAVFNLIAKDGHATARSAARAGIFPNAETASKALESMNGLRADRTTGRGRPTIKYFIDHD